MWTLLFKPEARNIFASLISFCAGFYAGCGLFGTKTHTHTDTHTRTQLLCLHFDGLLQNICINSFFTAFGYVF